MTLSREVRRNAMDKALKLLLARLGLAAIDSTLFDPSAESFACLPRTTWKELEEAGLVERDPYLEPPRYRLTGVGWIEAIVSAGTFGSAPQDEELGRLAACFKMTVKERNTDAQVDLKTVSSEAGLPEGWVFNVVESNLLETRFQRRGVYWHEQHRGRVIIVPSTFGLEKVDRSESLLAQVAQLQEQLAERNEILADILCPHCGAPVSTQGPVEHEYGDSLYQSFECGYAATDGCVDSPCPDSADFPSIDEFDFHFSEMRGNSFQTWSCYALGQTTRARRLHLPEGVGRTQEEAKEYVLDWYRRRARPWKAR